jgi:hypothetical protein
LADHPAIGADQHRIRLYSFKLVIFHQLAASRRRSADIPAGPPLTSRLLCRTFQLISVMAAAGALHPPLETTNPREDNAAS